MALLTTDTVCAYVAEQLASLGDASPIPAGVALTAVEVEGGNLNYAFQVKPAEGQSIFVKQAPDFIKVLGPSAKLEKERMKLEVQVYEEWGALLGAEMKAKYLPIIYKLDLTSMAFIMEFLGSFVLLTKSLHAGLVDLRVAGGMGEVMGLMHGKTHVKVATADEAARLTTVYKNEQLRGIQLEHVYTKPFRECDRPLLEKYKTDAELMAALDHVRAAYRGEEPDNLALCHGDLHPGSVMADEATGAVKIIDPEFAVYATPGVDLGSFISGYIMSYIAHTANGNAEAQGQVLAALGAMWGEYQKAMADCGVPAELVMRAGEDGVGLGCCNVSQELLGFAGVRTLPVADAELKRKAEDAGFELMVKFIKERVGKGIGGLIEGLKAFRV